MDHLNTVIAGLVLCATLLCPSSNFAQTIQQNETITAEKIAERIKQKKSQLTDVRQKETKVLSTLDDMEQLLVRQKREYNGLISDINAIQSKIRSTHLLIEELNLRAKARESILAKRLAAFYKYQRRSGLRILLSSPSYHDFVKLEKLFQTVVSRDYSLFSKCTADLALKQQQQTNLIQKKKDLEFAKKDLLKKRTAIETTRQKKVALLKQIRREKSLQLKALDELEEYARQLQDFVDRLPEEKPETPAPRYKFSRRKGTLKFPVAGKLLSTYGKKEHPETHTYTFQKGIEIKAEYGTEIKAVFDGTIVFADWFKGYGYLVIIDHGENYYSLSAHASKILKKVGDSVSEGDTIALVGDTHSIKGPCLYFEIRHHGKTQNPLKWLQKKSRKT